MRRVADPSQRQHLRDEPHGHGFESRYSADETIVPRALRPPRVVFVIGFVSLINSLTSAKTESDRATVSSSSTLLHLATAFRRHVVFQRVLTSVYHPKLTSKQSNDGRRTKNIII